MGHKLTLTPARFDPLNCIMRVLFISCLLIGSITCGPVAQEYGDTSTGTSFVRQPFPSGNLVSGVGVSSGSGSSLPSLTNPNSGAAQVPAPQDPISSAGPGSYSGTNMAVGNAFGGSTGVRAPGGSHAGGYDGSPSAWVGYDSSATGGSHAGGYDGSPSAWVGYGSASGGSHAGGYDGSPSAWVGYDSSASSGSHAGGYDGSPSAWFGYDSSASGGSHAGGYDGSPSAWVGYDSSATGGSHAGGYDGSPSAWFGYDSSASGGSHAGGYDGSAGASVGDTWSSGSTYGYGAGDDLEPVFSDVSDLDPVYYFSSRSNYQRGRSVFAQTRYTPEESGPQQISPRRVISKTSKQSSPKAPAKGAF